MYQFSLNTLLSTIKAKKKLLFVNCSIAVVVAVVVGFSIPKEYVSRTRLAIESKENSEMGGMSALTSMVGLKMGSSADAIGPDLYPDVVVTNDFLVSLLDTKVETVDGEAPITFVDYIANHTKEPWWSSAIGGCVSGISSIFGKGEDEQLPDVSRINPEYLSPAEHALIGGLKGVIDCSVNSETNVISINVRLQDPKVAKILVDTVTSKLQFFITQYRTNKARTDLQYYRRLEQEAHRDYVGAQKAYADFCDAHNDVLLQSYITKRNDLENELQLAYNNYSQVRQQVQLAEAKVQENTPAFTVVEKAAVSSIPVSPRKSFIVIAFVFLTCLGTLAWIYVKLLWGKVR